MASSSMNHLDTPISLKVNYEGTTRRYKLPLRDLHVTVLENKVSISYPHHHVPTIIIIIAVVAHN